MLIVIYKFFDFLLVDVCCWGVYLFECMVL